MYENDLFDTVLFMIVTAFQEVFFFQSHACVVIMIFSSFYDLSNLRFDGSKIL